MKVSWIKYEKDKESFSIPQKIGLDVVELNNLEKTDEKINELISAKYNMIILTNEVASFSEDIIKKYKRDTNVSIVIAPSKRINE